MYDVPQTMPTGVHEEQAVYAAKTLTTEEKLLQFCSVPRSRQELIDFLGFSRYYTMSKLVQPLLDAQKLALTLPEKPKSSKQRYFKP